MILHQGLIHVPQALRKELIRMYHDDPLYGHQGTGKTIERITRMYHSFHLSTEVENYIKNCDTCKKTKHARHQPYGIM